MNQNFNQIFVYYRHDFNQESKTDRLEKTPNYNLRLSKFI
jgi:hypothetical protein